MINITINNRTFKAPTNWAECSRSQAEALAVFIGYQLSGISNQVSAKETPYLYRPQQEALICAWLRCTAPYWAKVNLQAHEYLFLLKNCEWILGTSANEEPAKAIELSFEYIEHNGKKYYLPEANFKTVTALEIAWANMDWLGYQALVAPESQATEAEIENAINELLSIVIRPIRPDYERCKTDSTWNGDKRMPLAYHICAQIKKEITDMPIATKRLVLAYFESMNLAFMQEFEVLFGAGSTSESNSVAPKYPEGFGWEAALRRIAKEGTFGDYDKVGQTNGRQIWLYEYQKYLELEAELATMKMQEEKRNK